MKNHLGLTLGTAVFGIIAVAGIVIANPVQQGRDGGSLQSFVRQQDMAARETISTKVGPVDERTADRINEVILTQSGDGLEYNRASRTIQAFANDEGAIDYEIKPSGMVKILPAVSRSGSKTPARDSYLVQKTKDGKAVGYICVVIGKGVGTYRGTKALPAKYANTNPEAILLNVPMPNSARRSNDGNEGELNEEAVESILPPEGDGCSTSESAELIADTNTADSQGLLWGPWTGTGSTDCKYAWLCVNHCQEGTFEFQTRTRRRLNNTIMTQTRWERIWCGC